MFPQSTTTRSALAETLEALAAEYGPEHLDSDPLRIPHAYERPDDREIAAFVAAPLAFGNAKAICASAEMALRRLGPSPSRAVSRMVEGRGSALSGPMHRWVRGEDLRRFLAGLGRLRKEHGTLEDAFLAGDDGAPDLRATLAAFVRSLQAVIPGPHTRGLSYLLTSPESGSACKRWNMLLRWLVRQEDGLDLGLWTRLSPARLTIPLDTHVARIGRYIGLTDRRTPDWRAASEITDALRDVDPRDPVRFDFALSRLGILAHCPRRRDADRCRGCSLFELCTLT